MRNYKLPLLDNREILFNSLCAEDADRYYQALLSSNSHPELEEYIFNLVTEDRYKDQLDKLEAGIVLTVIYSVFHFSKVIKNINEFPDLIAKARQKNDSLYSILYIKICQAMPYKLEELKSKSLDELLDLFAIAENITKDQVDLKKLKEGLAIASGENKKESKPQVSEEQLSSLMQHLNYIQSADLDEDGRFIGDTSLV